MIAIAYYKSSIFNYYDIPNVLAYIYFVFNGYIILL